MIDNVTFGGFVRTLRKEKQMTQLELAKILNLSENDIQMGAGKGISRHCSLGSTRRSTGCDGGRVVCGREIAKGRRKSQCRCI